MTRTTTLHRSFAAGEVSPLLLGRVDLVPYQTGLGLCKNFVTMPQGPARLRPGTQFYQYGADLAARLAPFTYSDDQSYLIEFSAAGHLRIHTALGTLLDDAGDVAITSLTQAAPCLIGFPAGSFADGDDVYLEVDGMVEVSGRWYRLAFQSTGGGTDLFALGTPTMPGGIDSTGYGAFASGTASVPVQLAHPYSDAELPSIRYTQSADVMTVVHPNHPVHALRRTGPNAWTFTPEPFGPGAAAPATFTATGSGSGGNPAAISYTVTSVVVDGSTNAESFAFSPGQVVTLDLTVAGNYVDLASGAPAPGTRHNYYKALNGLYGFIGQGSGTFRDQNIVPNLAIAPPEYGPDFAAAGGYPRAVTYHQQRKVFGGSINAPQTLWLSRTGTENDFTNTIPARDDNSVTAALASRELHAVQHLVPLQDLLALTGNGVWKITGDANGVITPSGIGAKQESRLGSSHVQPAVTEAAVLYAFSRGGHVGEIRYQGEGSTYTVRDVALLAPHLFDGYSIVDMAVMEAPTRLLWVVRSDGALLSMTYQPDHQIVAWHQHDIGGAVRSLAVVPHINDLGVSEDVLWLFVERDTGAGRYAAIEALFGFGDLPTDYRPEYFGPAFDLAAASAVHADSALVYEGEESTRVIGLHHLEGRSVAVVSAGAVHPPLTVMNGEITLEHPTPRAVIGEAFVGRLQTLPLRIEGMRGVGAEGAGRMKNVSRVHLRFFQTGGVFVGQNFDRLDELKARTDEAFGVAPKWKTGEHEIAIDPHWSSTGEVCIEQRDPLPLVLLNMAIDVEVGG